MEFTKRQILQSGLKTIVEGTEGENNPKTAKEVKLYKLSDKVVKILEAARESAKSGKQVEIK